MLNHVEIREKYHPISLVQEVAVCRYIHLVLREESLKRKKEKRFPFFCYLLVNNREIIKGTFSGNICRS